MNNHFRVVFVNLHENIFFLQKLSSILSGVRTITKHRFLLDWLLDNHVEVLNLITINGTSLPSKAARKLTRNYTFRKLEAAYVFRKNRIPSSKVHSIIDPTQIRSTDIVIYYGTFMPSQFDNIEKVNGVKIVDQVHFYGDAQKADFLKDKGFRYYMYEVDLAKYSKLYQKNYKWFDGKYIMRPYSYEPRFQVKRPFCERKRKAVAMGTLTKCSYPEFVEAYGTEYYQPHRKMIMEHAAEYPEELDSHISEYEEKALKKIGERDNALVRAYKFAYNFFTGGKQKSYFSFDMVDKYNEYQMFICPEDVNGSYGVGTLEGMACGCAMIGLNYGAFEDMGMSAGVHYISYDGTMGDLVEKIRYYQDPVHQEDLAKIAETGCRFVRERFSPENVAKEYYEKLVQVVEEERGRG